MNNEYYGAASTPTEDFFAHYGVRGMKWGVTKALHKGTDKALKKEYAKAQKKLSKLKDEADISKQKTEIKYHGKKALTSGLAGVGLGGLTVAGLKNLNYNIANSPYETITNKNHTTHIIHPSTSAKISGGLTAASALGTVGLLGKSGYHTGMAIRSKYKTTSKGHKKAVEKYSNFRNAVNEAFSGTKYGKKGVPSTKKRRKNNG